MKRHTTISLIAAMLAGTLFCATAGANNGRIYPGNICQPAKGSEASNFDAGTRSVMNISTGSGWVSCPIIRDLSSATKLIKRVRIHVERRYGSEGDFHCWFDNMNAQGDWTNYRYGSYSGSGKHEMVITMTPATGTLYQSLNCRLPPDSELHYYTTSTTAVD